MLDTSVVQQQQLQIAVLMLIGFACAKTRILTDHTFDALVRFVMYVGLPSMLINKLPRVSNRETILNALPLFFFSFLVYAFLLLVGYLTGRILGYRGNRLHVNMTQTCTGNLLLIGFPILLSLFGDIAGPYLAVILLVDQTYLYLVDFPLTFPAENGWKLDLRYLKQILKSSALPSISALAIASLMIVLGISIPENSPVGTALNGIMGTCQPLSIIFLGGKVAELRIKKGSGILGGFCTVLVRMLVMPCFIYWVSAILPVPVIARQVLAMTVALPSVLATTMMTRINHTDCDYATVNVCITTVCYVFTLPIVGSLINSI